MALNDSQGMMFLLSCKMNLFSPLELILAVKCTYSCLRLSCSAHSVSLFCCRSSFDLQNIKQCCISCSPMLHGIVTPTSTVQG